MKYFANRQLTIVNDHFSNILACYIRGKCVLGIGLSF